MRRRAFLATTGAALTAPAWAALGDPAFLAAAKQPDGTYALHGLRADGTLAFGLPLPARGHAAAAHPTRPLAVAFARRPGTFALVIDCAEGRETHRLVAPKGQHFQGHGAFLDGGRLLATSENAYDLGDGRIGLWDVDRGFERVGEMPSGGVGPHEIIRLPGDVLAVANGGILTHPATGREKLNLDTMRPNLTYLRDGEVVDRIEPPHPRLSIRHLAAREDGPLAMAMQWEGDPTEQVPLLGRHTLGRAATWHGADLAPRMRGYAGSVAWSGDGRSIAITGPRGGLAAIWTDGARNLIHRTDICGVAPGRDGLVFTDGLGGILTENGATKHDLAWDNHLIAIG